jgi:hypothetical protein
VPSDTLQFANENAYMTRQMLTRLLLRDRHYILSIHNLSVVCLYIYDFHSVLFAIMGDNVHVNASRSSLIRLKVLEAVSVKKDCCQYRLVKDRVKIQVLCSSKEHNVKQKFLHAGVYQDSFCPQSYVVEQEDAPGIYTIDEEGEMLLLDDVVSLAFDFVNAKVRTCVTSTLFEFFRSR